MPATEALRLLEQVLQEAEIAGFKHRQLLHASALPTWVNCDELPDPPAPPQWLLDLMEDDD
jgi:hypothetical protein